MESNIESNVTTYLLKINVHQKELLGNIRHWLHLKIAFDADIIWVKDFTKDQITSTQVNEIPFIEIFYIKNNLLFKKDSLVPEGRMHSGLLWTPINRALPIEIENHNHNFFGIEERINIKLVKANTEHEPHALLTTINDARDYINTAPTIRLKKMTWLMIDKNLFIIGKPLLPLIGSTYWFKNDFFLPTGFDFELSVLEYSLQAILNPQNDKYIIWNKDATYIVVDKHNVKPLSISSYRQTTATI